MRMTSLAVLLAMQTAVFADESEPVLTRAPFTYILDYGPRHINSPEYIEAIAAAPPTLLHLGKDVPFTHNWGPIQALGGENQAYGKRRPYADEDYIRRLTPDETKQRIADLTALAGDLHKAGVHWVTPYICSMTIGGHAERRTGFWEFFDHWSDYAQFGLGPRPATDPLTWMQRDGDGGLRFFYTFQGPFYPAYEPNMRYAACQNNPAWRQWTERVVENVARCGFDGVFVDNAGSLRCCCPFCREKWKAWIAARYTTDQRQELFDTPEPGLSDDLEPGLLLAETNRFRCACLAEHLSAIAEAGRRVLGRPFIVFPNGGEKRPEHILHIYSNTDFIMFERSVGPNGTHPGMVLRPMVEDISIKRYNDNVFEYKCVQCLRRKVRPILLTRPGYRVPRSERLILEMNPKSAALGNAEAAAFGGGGAFLQRVDPDLMAVQKQYREFFEQHEGLYEGLDSFAEVAVVVLPDLVWFDGDSRHQREVRTVSERLLDGHILFDYLIDDQLAYKNLKKYSAIVLPRVSHLNGEQAGDLERYVADGGTLVVTGGLAERNEVGRSPAEPMLSGLVDAAALSKPFSIGRIGKGAAVVAEHLPAGPAQFVEWLQQAVQRDLSAIDGPATPGMAKVRINAFRQPGQSRYVVHLVNYNVPLGVEDRSPEIQGPVELALRLPGIASKPAILAYDSEGGATDLAATVDDGQLRVTVPQLRIYTVLEIVGR